MVKKVLVTGGAGFIGSHVCKALAKRGHEPVVYDNLSTGHRDLVRYGRLIEGDVGDGERLQAMLRNERIDAVIHLAGLCYPADSMRAPLAYYQQNVRNSLVLCDAMAAAGVGTLVFSSSCSVYGHASEAVDEQATLSPMSPYARSKMLVEQMLSDIAVEQDWTAVSLRYFNAAGADPDGELGEWHEPEPHLIPRVLMAATGTLAELVVHGTDYPTADGTCVRDYCHVTDLAVAHVLALERVQTRGALSIFNLGNERGFSVLEIIQAVETELGLTVPVRLAGRRPGDPASVSASSRKARDELGWSPQYASLTDIIRTAHRSLAARPNRTSS
ncbi:MAG: UDP-glucose 4-epimerase GalE [Ahniella sp.]|nr:UDP-glucose 4-epimerase GalE [Ahniella sp.]